MFVISYNFEQELNNFGLTKENFELCLKDISDKTTGINDYDWADIIEKYNLNCAKDTLRKASSMKPFGGAFVYNYLKESNVSEINNNIELAKKSYKSETDVNKDGSITSNKLIEITENDLKDKNALLKAHGFD